MYFALFVWGHVGNLSATGYFREISGWDLLLCRIVCYHMFMTFREAVDQSDVSLAFIAKRGGWRLENVKRWYRQGAPRGAFGRELIEALDVDEARKRLEKFHGREATPGRVRNEIGDFIAMVASRGRIAPKSGRAVSSIGKRSNQVIKDVRSDLVSVSEEKKLKLWEQSQL